MHNDTVSLNFEKSLKVNQNPNRPLKYQSVFYRAPCKKNTCSDCKTSYLCVYTYNLILTLFCKKRWYVCVCAVNFFLKSKPQNISDSYHYAVNICVIWAQEISDFLNKSVLLSV